MNEFFSGQPSFPPTLDFVGHLVLVLSLVFVVLGVFKYHENKKWQVIFKGLQVLQLVLLYGWYIVMRAPLSEALPLYHCRIAMFVLLLAPDDSPYKEYFSLIGVFGAICALVYPVFDPFPWFHVTIFSFIIGHIALFGNALHYLLCQVSRQLSFGKIAKITFELNIAILAVDLVTGGDYGFLRKLPLLGDFGLVWNYVIETLLFILVLTGLSLLFRSLKSKKELVEKTT